MSAQVIAVQSVSPGVGRSSLAANLAFELASRGSRTCLVDLDEVWPSLHRYFGLPQQRASVLAAMRFQEQNRLDANSLEEVSVRIVAKAASVDFLSGYGLSLNQRAVNLDSLASMIGSLADRYDAVVVDTAAGVEQPVAQTVAGLATQSVLVIQPDAVSLGRFLEGKDRLRLAAASTLVVNRMRKAVVGARPEWQVQQVLRENTNYRIATVVPEDPAFDASLMKGLPLRQVAPRSKALAAIGELADRLAQAAG